MSHIRLYNVQKSQPIHDHSPPIYNNCRYNPTNLNRTNYSKSIHSTMKPTGIKSLPRELIGNIADKLNVKDIVSFSSTNAGINRAIQYQLKETARNRAFAPKEYYKNAIVLENGELVLDQNMVFNAPPEPIVTAIAEDNANKLEGYLDAGIDVNAYSIYGERLLYIAVGYRANQVIQLLLSRGAGTNMFNIASQNTPLAMAACNHDNELVCTLIEAGADVNAPNAVSCMVQNCTLETLMFAIGRGARLRETHNEGTRFLTRGVPLLHDAAMNPSTDVLDFIIDLFPNTLNATDEIHGRNALWAAAQAENVAAVRILITAGINIDHLNNDRETILHEALESMMHTEIPRVLLESGILIGVRGRAGMTELHYAAYYGAANMVRMLLTENMYANSRDAHRRTPLHLAARRGHIAAAYDLIEWGDARLECTDTTGRTPKDIALARGHREFVDYIELKLQELAMPS